MRTRAAAVIAVALLSGALPALAQESERLARAEAYARQDHHCALDHGYVCRPAAVADNFESVDSNNAMIPASYLRAWQQAAADFAVLQHIAPERRQLRHYKFGFTEDDEHYIIHFQALLLPEMKEGEPDGIIRATFGLTTRYWVTKATMEIARRLHYKT